MYTLDLFNSKFEKNLLEGAVDKVAEKKEDNTSNKYKDVAVQRAMRQATAEFPAAASDAEAFAKSMMVQQDQDQKNIDRLKSASQRNRELIDKNNNLDQTQARSINDIQSEIDKVEKDNDSLTQMVQRMSKANAELQDKLSRMRSKAPAGTATTAVSSPQLGVSVATDKELTTEPAPQASPIDIGARQKLNDLSKALTATLLQLKDKEQTQGLTPDEQERLEKIEQRQQEIEQMFTPGAGRSTWTANQPTYMPKASTGTGKVKPMSRPGAVAPNDTLRQAIGGGVIHEQQTVDPKFLLAQENLNNFVDAYMANAPTVEINGIGGVRPLHIKQKHIKQLYNILNTMPEGESKRNLLFNLFSDPGFLSQFIYEYVIQKGSNVQPIDDPQQTMIESESIPAKQITQGYVVEFDPRSKVISIGQRGQVLKQFRLKLATRRGYDQLVNKFIHSQEDLKYPDDIEDRDVRLPMRKLAEAQEEFVFYINGKPAAKYQNEADALRDMALIKKKYPDAVLDLKQEVCDVETIRHIAEGQSIFEELPAKAKYKLQQWLNQQNQPHQEPEITTAPAEPQPVPARLSDLQSQQQKFANLAGIKKAIEKLQGQATRGGRILPRGLAADLEDYFTTADVDSAYEDMMAKYQKQLGALQQYLGMRKVLWSPKKETHEMRASELQENKMETWTVHFTDGTAVRVRVSDETDPAAVRKHYANKGKTVAKFDYGFGVDPEAGPGPEAHEPGSGRATSARTGDPLPEDTKSEFKAVAVAKLKKALKNPKLDANTRKDYETRLQKIQSLEEGDVININRGGYNQFRDKNDFLDKRDYIQKQLLDPRQRENYAELKQRLQDINYAGRKLGYI